MTLYICGGQKVISGGQKVMHNIVFLWSFLFKMQEMSTERICISHVNMSITQHKPHQLVRLQASAKHLHACLARTRFCPDRFAISSLFESHLHHLQNLSRAVYL